MPRQARVWLLLLVARRALPSSAAPGCDAGAIGIATLHTAACIRSSDGTVASLTDLASSRVYSSYTDLFQVALSVAFAPHVTVLSSNCTAVRVAADGASCIAARFGACGAAPGLVVSTSVCANASSQLLEWRVNVTAVPTQLAVSSVVYPMVAPVVAGVSAAHYYAAAGPDGVATHATAANAFDGGTGGGNVTALLLAAGSPHAVPPSWFLSSSSDSVVVPVTPGVSLGALYPGIACAQLLAQWDATSGLLMYTADADAHVKSLGVTATASYWLLSTRLYPPAGELAGGDVVVPYAVAVSTFTGDWRDAADAYAEWALAQWWAATPLSARTDIPRVMLTGAAGTINGIQDEQGFNPDVYGADLELLANDTAALKAVLGAPAMIAVTYGWEHDGTWAGIEYLPPVPSAAAWTGALAALHAQGDEALFLPSGFWWVVARNVSNQGPAFNNTDRVVGDLADALIIAASGARFEVNAYATPDGNSGWRGLSYKLCHGASAGRDALVGSFTGLLDIGAVLLSFDQEIGGGQTESGCYHAPSPMHAHAPGQGSWMFAGMNATFAAVHAHAMAARVPLGMSTEQTCEVLIPSVATSYSRQFAVAWWPWSEVDGASPGLFSYLYHHLLPVCAAEFNQGGGDGSPGYHMRRLAFANGLTRGLTPLYGRWDVAATAPANSWVANATRAAAVYARVPQHWLPFFAFGITVRPPRVSTNDTVETFVVHGGVRYNMSLPTVTTGAFTVPAAAADGAPSALAVIASLSDAATTFALDLSASGWTGGVTTLYNGATGGALLSWPTPPQVPINVTIDEPCGVRVLVIQHAALPPPQRQRRRAEE